MISTQPNLRNTPKEVIKSIGLAALITVAASLMGREVEAANFINGDEETSSLFSPKTLEQARFKGLILGGISGALLGTVVALARLSRRDQSGEL